MMINYLIINYFSEKDEWKKNNKNNPTIASHISYVKKNKYISFPIFFQKIFSHSIYRLDIQNCFMKQWEMDYLPGTVARHTQTKNLLTEKFFILTPQKKQFFKQKTFFKPA